MQTLEVTDEQYAVIQRLRTAISEDVVGKYGFVRERDAVQFLIDNLEDEFEADLGVDLDGEGAGSTATDEVAAAVDAAMEGASDDVEAVAYDETADTGSEGRDADPETSAGLEEKAPVEDEGDGDVADDGDAGVADDETDTDSDEAVEEDGESGADEADEADETDDSDQTANGDADDDDMLNRMMSLLETHDDKWEESPSADYRYRVTLPDGSTEDVQTKDDVRAILFKNY